MDDKHLETLVATATDRFLTDAREEFGKYGGTPAPFNPPPLEWSRRFARLLAEECAKVADAQAAVYTQKRDALDMASERWEERESQRDAMENIAAELRHRFR